MLVTKAHGETGKPAGKKVGLERVGMEQGRGPESRGPEPGRGSRYWDCGHKLTYSYCR